MHRPAGTLSPLECSRFLAQALKFFLAHSVEASVFTWTIPLAAFCREVGETCAANRWAVCSINENPCFLLTRRRHLLAHTNVKFARYSDVNQVEILRWPRRALHFLYVKHRWLFRWCCRIGGPHYRGPPSPPLVQWVDLGNPPILERVDSPWTGRLPSINRFRMDKVASYTFWLFFTICYACMVNVVTCTMFYT